MSKKHFIAIATAIRMSVKNANGDGEVEGIRYVASELCDVFASINPLFDRERFLTACGVLESQ